LRLQVNQVELAQGLLPDPSVKVGIVQLVRKLEQLHRLIEHGQNAIARRRADGVDGLVPVEAFAEEAVCRLLHGIFVAEGDLILDDAWIAACSPAFGG